jgi:pimeloyl-ACP methyl ester carboxylesterase
MISEATMGVHAEFLARYDAMLARWPVPVETLDIPARHGTTRVIACGPADGPAAVLLPGGGATATVWWSTVGALADTHRVYAVDVIGDRGRSVYDGEPIAGETDLMQWLDGILDSAGVPDTMLVGHSYGGWLATRYALHAPHRVNRLALLEPSAVLAPNRPVFGLRAVPLLFARSRRPYASFVRWETGGRPLDAGWLELWSTPFGGRTQLVFPRQVSRAELATIAVPVTIVLCGQSRQAPAAQMARVARAALPHARVTTIPDATHFTVPQQHPDEVGAALRDDA